jgi:hypothetical protein
MWDRKMNKNFYIGLIEAVDKKEAFVQVLYSSANSVGDAIDSMLNYAKKSNLKRPIISEVNIIQLENLPKEAIRLPELDIYYLKSRYYFPLCDYPKFQLPYGVVSSSQEGKFETDLINEGYKRYVDENIEHLLIVVDRARLLKIYLEIVESLKSIRVLWLRVASDWEYCNIVEFYSNESLNSYLLVKEFILENFSDVFLNGYLSMTVYSDEGEINVTIDDHKMIHISSAPCEFIDIVSEYIENKGFKYYEQNNLYSIDCGYYHWHYKPQSSKNRQDLDRHLKDNGFTLWRTE